MMNSKDKLAKKMKNGIKGFQSVSLIDYPGNIVSVVFFSGCNFRCPFCHNKDLVFKNNKIPYMDACDILNNIEKRKKIIDGICITGGEPTLCAWLTEFIKAIKKKNLKVKLDTNGTMPDTIKKLIAEKLIDYIAMDIKAPKEKYNILSGVENSNIKKIEKSIYLIKKSNTEYEFRTTVVPKYLSKEDILSIAKWINRGKKYVIQQFRPINTLNELLEKEKAYSVTELKEIKKEIENYFECCEIRGI